jgi:hypothetical protein
MKSSPIWPARTGCSGCLQGDVGSGKTAVAMLAMADAVEAGGQAVLMAPTEILARQHYATIEKMAAAPASRLSVLTARAKGKERAELLERIANGQPRSSSGPMRCFRTRLSTTTSPWPWSTSSTVSACISVCA